jgi:hypothetical protein
VVLPLFSRWEEQEHAFGELSEVLFIKGGFKIVDIVWSVYPRRFNDTEVERYFRVEDKCSMNIKLVHDALLKNIHAILSVLYLYF